MEDNKEYNNTMEIIDNILRQTSFGTQSYTLTRKELEAISKFKYYYDINVAENQRIQGELNKYYKQVQDFNKQGWVFKDTIDDVFSQAICNLSQYGLDDYTKLLDTIHSKLICNTFNANKSNLDIAKILEELKPSIDVLIHRDNKPLMTVEIAIMNIVKIYEELCKDEN